MRTLGRERFYGKRPLPSKIGSEEPIFATFPKGEGFGAAFTALGGLLPPHCSCAKQQFISQKSAPIAAAVVLLWACIDFPDKIC